MSSQISGRDLESKQVKSVPPPPPATPTPSLDLSISGKDGRRSIEKLKDFKESEEEESETDSEYEDILKEKLDLGFKKVQDSDEVSSSSCSLSLAEQGQIIRPQSFGPLQSNLPSLIAFREGEFSANGDSDKFDMQILSALQLREKNAASQNEHHETSIGGLTTSESKRQRYHLYLKKSGLLSAIAKSILALFECEEFPPVDQVGEFIANQLGYSMTIRDDIAEIKNLNEILKTRIQEKRDENNELRNRLDNFESSETPIEFQNPDDFDPRFNPDFPPEPVQLTRRVHRPKPKLNQPTNYGMMEKNIKDNESKMKKTTNSEEHSKHFQYPIVKRDETAVEILHGVKVEHPYHWLENCESEQVQNFITDQNKLTMSYLEDCPQRNVIKESLAGLLNFERYSCPSLHGGRYYFFRNTGLQNQSVLCVQDKLNDTPKVLLDPNPLSADGTLAISGHQFSENGQILAYALSQSGSDWRTIYFKNVATGQDYPDVLKKIKFSEIAWTHDHKGIFYSWYPIQEGKTDGAETTLNTNEKLYYHLLGTSQENDILITEYPDHPQFFISGTVSNCGQYLMVRVGQEIAKNSIFYTSLLHGVISKPKLKPIVPNFDADYDYITNEKNLFYFRTNKNAPNFRIIRIDVNDPDENKWVNIIPENTSSVLSWVDCVDKDKLIMVHIKDVKNTLTLVNLKDGSLFKSFPLEVGTIVELTASPKNTEFFFKFSSFVTAGRIYRVDLTNPIPKIEAEIFQESLVHGLHPENFNTQQVFYHSKDGTKIPMFLVYRKDLPLKGDNLCLLYGYGGFNYSITPQFFPFFVPFLLNLDGVLAIANIRGGGEYGEMWHQAGTQLNKQKTFDDFCAAGEYLIKYQFTSPLKLIIRGASNGGFCVAACFNQRPELFAVAIAEVGVMDLIHFHKFTIGYTWTAYYGSPDDKQQFENLIKLSPLHNVQPLLSKENGQYPAILLLTADHNDRVVPLHSYKMIAQLQHKIGKLAWQTNPLMIRIYTKAGHSGGVSLEKRLQENTDIISFIVQTLKVQFKA